MTKESLLATPVSRRKLLRNGLLTGLGAAAVGAAQVFTGKAQAASGGMQYNWNWCNKCTGLFYGPQYSSSWCPAGGQHNGADNPNPDSSYDYILYYNYPSSELGPDFQGDWNWCSKCRGLFYGPQQSSSWCPAGGQHNGSGSYDYQILFGDQIGLGAYWQESWSWCNKCTGLFYGPQQPSSYCPAGGQHNGSGSYDYWLQFAV